MTDRQMNLKEKFLMGLEVCMDEESNGLDCPDCPYENRQYAKRDGDDFIVDFTSGNCLYQIKTDAIKLIKAYDFALSQYKKTLEELIENNDGDVKEICVFLLNLLRIKEVDIEKGIYI